MFGGHAGRTGRRGDPSLEVPVAKKGKKLSKKASFNRKHPRKANGQFKKK